jgi:hypothetical protein
LGIGLSLFHQADDSGGNEYAEDNSSAVQEDILDGTAAAGNHELVYFIRDGIDAADQETEEEQVFLPAEPAFQADPETETKNGENEYMGELPDQALDEEDKGYVVCFVAFPDGIEQVKFKETGIPHGIPDGEAEAFGLLLLLGREDENGDHDHQNQGSTEVSDPGFLKGL